MTIVYLALAAFMAVLLSTLSYDILVFFLRRRGRYPAKGGVTLADVQRLVREGENVLAMRAYRELSGASLKEAREFVEELERSLT